MIDSPPLDALRELVRAAAVKASGDDERIDLIRQLEVLKCVLESTQGEAAADLDASQRAEQAARGVPQDRQGTGVAAQIALARRESPHRGSQHLSLAKILRSELPHTRAAFAEGRLSEWRATLIARETACLSLEDRKTVDEQVAGDPDSLEATGDTELVGKLRGLAYELDPASFVERRRRAESDRNVTLRPAPDVMGRLSALLAVRDAVAVFATLKQIADSLVTCGDGRTRGQIMADTLVDRITGRVPASGDPSPAPQVVINVVVDDDVLLGANHAPGHLDGYGPIPADLVVELATPVQTAMRRLYAIPETGSLVAMDSRARHFPDGLATFVRLRDRFCRTPWCGAPIRHIDHAEEASSGGPTSSVNGQGKCEACNYATQAPGWRAGPAPGPRHTIQTITPTGHRHRSVAPPTRHRPGAAQSCRVVVEIYRDRSLELRYAG